jgi:hypothetical protein
MVVFLLVIIALCVLRKCGLYNKEIGKGITVKHVVNVIIYTLMFCICPIFALILFFIFDLKPLCSMIKNRKGSETNV